MQKCRSGVDGVGEQDRSQLLTGGGVGEGAGKEPDAFLAGDGKVDQDDALAGLLFGHHGVKQLAHRGVDLGNEGQALEQGLKDAEGLATNDQ